MEQLKPIPSDRAWRRTLAVFAGALILFYMVCPVAPQRWTDLYNSYGRTAIIAMAAIYFFRARLSGVIEVRLVVWYTIWLFVTRLLNTDLYLQNEYELLVSRVLCCVVLPVGLLLEEKERRVLLDILIAVAGAYYFVTALISLYACIFGVYIYLPPEHVVFGIDNMFYGNSFAYIVAWETSRIISAVWFYLAWCMMAYEFFRCKNKLWRIPICLAWFVFHLAIAFCFCRSIKLAASVNAAMLAILLGMRWFQKKKLALRTALIGLLAVLSLVLCYKSFEWLNSGAAAVYNALDVQIERTADQFMGEDFRESTADGQNFEDTRDLAESITNVSRRSNIYNSVIPTLKADPMRLLIGKYSSKIMDVPHQFQDFPYWHMHNYLLQVLMLTGLLGLLLVAAFTVLLVVRMLRLFFSPDPRADLSVKLLTLPLGGVLIYGMFETILFTASADERALTDFRELFFFLLAGMLLAWSYELAPAKKRG